MKQKTTYPEPKRDENGQRKTMGMGEQDDPELNETLITGHVLNRVSDLLPGYLVDGKGTDSFAHVDEAGAFQQMYVVDVTHYDDDGDELPPEGKKVRVFDLRTERTIEVPALVFVEHYGTTIWNLNTFWDEK